MVGGFSVKWPHFFGEEGSWDLLINLQHLYANAHDSIHAPRVRCITTKAHDIRHTTHDMKAPRHQRSRDEIGTFERCRFQRWWLYIRTLLIPVINSPLIPRWPISWHNRVPVPVHPLSQLPIRHTPRTEIWEAGGRGMQVGGRWGQGRKRGKEGILVLVRLMNFAPSLLRRMGRVWRITLNVP